MSEKKHELNCLKSQAYGTGCSCGVEPVASLQATRTPERVLLDELGKLEHRQLRDEHGQEIKGALWVKLHDVAGMIGRWAAHPAAGTTPHIHECDHETEGEHVCRCVICGKHIGTLPSEGTTPQGERPLRNPNWQETESLTFNAVWNAIKKWDISRAANGKYASATGTDVCTILDALRAVAPVETPEEEATFKQRTIDCAKELREHYNSDWDSTVPGAEFDAEIIRILHRHFDRVPIKAPAQTRLTAEQFWRDEYVHGHSKLTFTDEFEYWCKFAEAFRDKSEAELREEIERLNRQLSLALKGEDDALRACREKGK